MTGLLALVLKKFDYKQKTPKIVFQPVLWRWLAQWWSSAAPPPTSCWTSFSFPASADRSSPAGPWVWCTPARCSPPSCSSSGIGGQSRRGGGRTPASGCCWTGHSDPGKEAFFHEQFQYSGSRLMWSRIKLSFSYCNQICPDWPVPNHSFKLDVGI